jgi:DNA replicative helicase MCM subunit Mcm2 (Cdc46/Mcm family)
MKSSKIIYSLNVEDIQTVALQEIERNLSPEEIKKIKESIAEKINWYDAIADSINEHIKVLIS